MAGTIKGITVEIGGDTAGLSKALSGINREINATQRELREVEKLLKLDPENTELLAQKERLLGEAIEETKTKLDALKQAEASAQEQFKKGEISRQQYDKLQREIIATEQKLEKLTSEASSNVKALDKIAKSADETADKLNKVGDKLAPVTAGVMALGAAAVAAVEGTEELRSDLSKLDQNAREHKVGVDKAREAWEAFTIASDETDSSVEATANLLQAGFTESNLQKAVENLTGAYLRFPDTMKVESLADSLQETLATKQATGQFAELLDRLGIGSENFSKGLAKCKTEAEKQNYALETLSKAGLADTYKGWQENNKELVANKKASLEMQKSLSKLAETVQPLVTAVVNAVADMVGWFNDLSPSAKKTTVGMLAFAASLSPIAKIGAKAAENISKVANKMKTIVKPALDAAEDTSLLGKALNAVTNLTLPGGGILAAFAGLSLAFGAYIASMDTMTKRTREYISEVQKMQETNMQAIESAKESAQEKMADLAMTQDMVARVNELNTAQQLDAEKKAELATLVGMLNEQYPDLNLELDKQGQLTQKSAENLQAYMVNLEKSIKMEALRGIATEQYRALYEQQQKVLESRRMLQENTAQLNIVESELASLTGMTAAEIGKQQLAQGNLNFVNQAARDRVSELMVAWGGLQQSSAALQTSIGTQEEAVAGLQRQYDSTMLDMTAVTSNAKTNISNDLSAVGTSATNMEKTVKTGADGVKTDVTNMVDGANKEIGKLDGNKAGSALANGMSDGISNNAWKVSSATQRMMSGVERAINSNPKFKALARNAGLPGFAKGGTLTSGLAVVGEEGPEFLSVQSGRATVIPMTTRQKQAVQGGGGGNVVNVGITINNGQFNASDAKRVARMVNRELGLAYR